VVGRSLALSLARWRRRSLGGVVVSPVASSLARWRAVNPLMLSLVGGPVVSLLALSFTHSLAGRVTRSRGFRRLRFRRVIRAVRDSGCLIWRVLGWADSGDGGGCRCVVPASCRVVRAFVASSRLRRVVRAFFVSSGSSSCRSRLCRWAGRVFVLPGSSHVILLAFVVSSGRSVCRLRVRRVVSFPVVVVWTCRRSSTSVTWHRRPAHFVVVSERERAG